LNCAKATKETEDKGQSRGVNRIREVQEVISHPVSELEGDIVRERAEVILAKPHQQPVRQALAEDKAEVMEEAAEAEIIIKLKAQQKEELTHYVIIVRRDIRGNAGGRQRLVFYVVPKTTLKQNVHRT